MAISVIFSIIASWVVWAIIWLVSIGEEGSWFCSWVTSRFMNTSESIDWLGVRVLAPEYNPAVVAATASTGMVGLSF